MYIEKKNKQTISDSFSACLNLDKPLKPRFSKHNPFIAYDSANIFRLLLYQKKKKNPQKYKYKGKETHEKIKY